MKSSIFRSAGTSAPSLGGRAGLAAFMLAMLFPLPEAAAGYQTSSSTACEGQWLEFEVSRPASSIYDGELTYKIKVKGGSAEAEQDYEQPPEELTFNAHLNSARFSVITFTDEIDEGEETVKLELREPKAPQFGGWVSVDGSQVRAETLVVQIIRLSGTIRDGTGQAASGNRSQTSSANQC